jgi:hypothetical protein
MRRLLALLAVGAVALTSCSGDDTSLGTEGPDTTLAPIPGPDAPEQDRLDAARARWAAAGIHDYEWTYERTCFCPVLIVSVEVQGDAAVDHRLEPGEGSPTPPDEEIDVLTIPDLFDEVQDAIDTADSFTVEYDAETGRVTTLDVDPIENAVDDELAYLVRSFNGTPSAPRGFDVATLTESWACGRGFHLSDVDETVALMLDLTDPTWTEPPPQTATLPDERWDARVLIGQDLFANWCDDVIGEDEPTPRTDETWPIVAGTISFADEVASIGTSCERPVTARVTGLVAERPDGSRVTIGDLDVTNSCWGGAAG